MPINFADTAPGLLEFPAHYYYRFYSSNGMEVYVLRDEQPPRITGGLGGWEIVDRRRRKGLTNWVGREPWQMSIPVLFNGWFDPPHSVDTDISVMNAMAFGDNFVIPPTVRVDGYVPVAGIKWVIQNIEYGSNAHWLRGDAGQFIRVRQDAVVSLLQYVEEDVVKTSTPSTGPAPTTYRTKAGDTPASIAKDRYGNSQYWTKIRDANPNTVRDPNQKLPVDTVLQLPSMPKKPA